MLRRDVVRHGGDADAGQRGDTGGIVHSFTYDTKHATFTEIDDPSAGSFTQAWGVNNSGNVAVLSDVGSYIYCDANCPSGARPSIKLNPTVVHAKAEPSHNPKAVKLALPKGAARQ